MRRDGRLPQFACIGDVHREINFVCLLVRAFFSSQHLGNFGDHFQLVVECSHAVGDDPFFVIKGPAAVYDVFLLIVSGLQTEGGVVHAGRGYLTKRLAYFSSLL